MTGTIAQIVALTAYGNDYLKNGKKPVDFNLVNTTFQFCNRVDFCELKKQFFLPTPQERVVASNPTEWFKYLITGDCQYLRLYFEYSQDQSRVQNYDKDYFMAGFVGGGGTWLIEAVYDNYSSYWANQWEVTRDLNVPDKKIWTVNYKMTVKRQHTKNLQIDTEKIKDKLRQTLTEIADFAFNHDLQCWGEQFDKAKMTLDSSSPEENYYHKDLIPFDNYSTTAKQILFAAGTAWCFGGMGSWNDGFPGKDEEDYKIYYGLSEQLYSNIIEAIIAATNSY